MVSRDAPTAPNGRVVLVVWIVLMAVIGWGGYRLFIGSDGPPAITHGDPARHVPVRLVFSGQLAGTMTRADNVIGQTSLHPDPPPGFGYIPLTGCAVMTFDDTEDGAGEIAIQGVVDGKNVVLRMTTDFRGSGPVPASLPAGVYSVSPSTPVYPNIYAGLDSQDGSIAMHQGTLGSTVTVDPGGRSGTLHLGLSNLSQKGRTSPALITVTGTWSCG